MSTETASGVITRQANYRPQPVIGPRYKYMRLNMSNLSSSSVSITATGSTQVHFKLPSNTVCNLARSKFECSVALSSQGGTERSYFWTDCFPFGAISLETGNGLQLMNLTEAPRFTKIVSKVQSEFKDYISNDESELLYPSNAIDPSAQTTPATGNSAYPNSTDLTQTYVIEPRYYSVSGAPATQTIGVSYTLGKIKNTMLGLDKDVYFGQNDIYLKFTIEGTDKWAFQTASNGSAAATLSVPLTSLTSVYLQLAVEVNPDINTELVNKFNASGLQLLIDYPIIQRQTNAAQTSQAWVINYTPANGKTLKRIYISAWNGTETLNTALDNLNTSGTAKITSYNTYLDSRKLQDDTVNCSTLDAWRINEGVCRGSVYLDKSMYNKGWFHCDCFESHDRNSNVAAENLVDGLPMTNGVQYQFTAASANVALVLTSFAIFQRMVLINRDGVQFV